MKFNRSIAVRFVLLISLMASLTVLSSRLQADTGSCGGVTITLPFTDVQGNFFFCQIAAAYFSGLTNGTTPTTYSPADNVTREQMAAFTTRTLDQSLKRGSKRAALNQWWTTQGADNLGLSLVASGPRLVAADGADIWVANQVGDVVSRVRASDGRLIETWSGAFGAYGVLVAMGKVFVSGSSISGKLYQIDPTQPAGVVTTLTSDLGGIPMQIAFDGQRIWTANQGSPGSVSIVTLNPVSVTTVTTGFGSLFGILYDGAHIWVTGNSQLSKLDSSGAILQTIALSNNPSCPAFDGTNLWVPHNSNLMRVVRVKDSAGNPLAQAFVLATLMGNGLDGVVAAAFDGERILVTNYQGRSVSLWKAADLTPIGSFSTGSRSPFGTCSDGLNFWIALDDTFDLNEDRLARF